MVSNTRESSPRIGCSGWLYRHWKGDIYPDSLPSTVWLEHYATLFDTVEINNSFYRLPEAATFAAWARRVPRRFLFAVKASRYLTHLKRLKEPQEPLQRLFDRARHLGPALGPVLYQLPPHWGYQPERFHDLLGALPPGRRHVLEFRDPDWYREEVFEAMARAGVSLCLHDMAGSESPRRQVGPLVYVRFHGAGTRYGGRYPDHALEQWAEWLSERTGAGARVFAYFNNDGGGHAPRDATRLRALVAGRG